MVADLRVNRQEFVKQRFRDVDLPAFCSSRAEEVLGVPVVHECPLGLSTDGLVAGMGDEVGHLDERECRAVVQRGAADEPGPAPSDVRLSTVTAPVEVANHTAKHASDPLVFAVDHDHRDAWPWRARPGGQAGADVAGGHNFPSEVLTDLVTGLAAVLAAGAPAIAWAHGRHGDTARAGADPVQRALDAVDCCAPHAAVLESLEGAER